MQKASADIPAELPIDDNSEDNTDDDTQTETDTDTDSDSDSDAEYECATCNRKFSGYIPLKQHLKGKKHAKAVLRKKKERKLLEKEEDTVAGVGELLIQEPFAVCKMCDKEFSGPESYHLHLKSKVHKQKVLEASILEQVRENGEINADKLKELYKSKRTTADAMKYVEEHLASLNDEDEKARDEFECKECDKIFTGLVPFTQHLLSKAHEKKVEKKKLLHKVVPETSVDDKIPDKDKKSDLSTLSIEDDVLVCKLCSTSFSGPESALLHLKSKKHSKQLDKHMRKLQKKKKDKESKKLDSDSDKKKEEQADKERDDELIKKQSESTSPSDEPEMSDKSTDEKDEEYSSCTDEEENEFLAREKHKKYKDLMDSFLKENENPN